MSVIPLTLFFSLLLAGIFVTLFALVFDRRRFASAERESLLPLAEESAGSGAAQVAPGREHDSAACGCRRGEHPSCESCNRSGPRADASALSSLSSRR